VTGLPTPAELAAQVLAFAEQAAPAKTRWEYALSRSSYVFRSPRDGHEHTCLNKRTIPVVARFLGVPVGRANLRLRTMRREGSFAAAEAWMARTPIIANPFAVGPIEPWQIGHVYFAGVADAPHVLKIGFSRRVGDRIADIEAKVNRRLNVVAVKVGTLADEHWWHHDWRHHRISGEWFFDPRADERTVPNFLQAAVAEAA
jgi:hypothetical protein